ncbi:MAG: hypothetical protein I3273_00055 [Candidatus Moeniiplasma glomeromycotorum]|nr:hypothetical protein [Candidatus Moeniiplasma glomeromycotorum]MCE8167477.1 hypothetical protein [Candidatus Moeniiplasma glomeromycotorum]MCE8168509.1 hypothetical protein [Candidatus Moeniiplasma glomeromycotorum]
MSQEVKLNNWTEILNKVKELVAQDKSWKIYEEYWALKTISFKPDGSRQETKNPRQGVRLVKGGESVDFFLRGRR